MLNKTQYFRDRINEILDEYLHDSSTKRVTFELRATSWEGVRREKRLIYTAGEPMQVETENDEG